MKPSSLRMRAISIFSFEAGTSTRGCLARVALRTRVSMSAMGSVCMSLPFLPARLDDAGNLPHQRQFAEAQAAHLELPQDAAAAAADAAAIAHADLELRLPLHLCELRGSGHQRSSVFVRNGMPSSLSSSRASSSERAEVVSVTFMPLILSTRV